MRRISPKRKFPTVPYRKNQLHGLISNCRNGLKMNLTAAISTEQKKIGRRHVGVLDLNVSYFIDGKAGYLLHAFLIC